MKHFFSVSKYPGKIGEHFYNGMFSKLNLPYTYTALGSDDIAQTVKELRDKKADGFSVSMPYKEEVIKHIDIIEYNVERFRSCNTVLRKDGMLYGYNTDYYGALFVSNLCGQLDCSILGDGAMGRMFKEILEDKGTIYSRKQGNWDSRHKDHRVIINCTSFGTATPESPFETLPRCEMVIDLALKDNQLKQQCLERDIKYVDGLTFYKHQFVAQFEIYTNKVINIKDLEGL